MSSHVCIIGHFETSALNDPRMTDTPYYTHYNYPRVKNFNPFRSTVSHVWVITYFETSTPNDLHMTLNTKRSNVAYIHVTTTPESQISPCFSVRTVAFELQAILRQVHWMTPKLPWTLKGQRYPVYMIKLLMSPNFTPFCSTASHFWVAGHFEPSAPNDP